MVTRFTNLDALVPFARARAQRGVYDGQASPQTMRLMQLCGHIWAFSPVAYARIIFTRDVGHHTGGWWKNPDYERCWHLSVSFSDAITGAPLPQDHPRALKLAETFFGDNMKLAWVEPPYSEEGQVRDVYHYRVFADEGWQPIKPRGEVYSRDWTPAHWRSFSEVHGYKPAAEDAPFLLAAGGAGDP